MTTAQLPVGDQLRQWRQRRRLSQLDLAGQAQVSTRHLSFVETGRSRPTAEMIRRLTEELDVPLRERNQLLLAGGYAPSYPESDLGGPQLAVVLDSFRAILAGHGPFPALVLNRWWELIDSNPSRRRAGGRLRARTVGAAGQRAAAEPASGRIGPADRQPGPVACAPVASARPPHPGHRRQPA